MYAHLRGLLTLLVLTVVICCVLYPLALWGIGKAVFREQAEGSLVTKDGQVKGSRLIGQPFTGAGYFWPRPSSAGSGNGYDASLSGGSNFGASNPRLRDRVARQLGPMVSYRASDKAVGEDVEQWLTPERVQAWAAKHPDAAGWWFESDKDANGKLIDEWLKTHSEEATAWKKDNPDADDPAAADLVVPFFAWHSRTPRTHWSADAKTAVQAVFFDSWLSENPDADIERVPADLVLSSGSGLDPHITLRGARYQASRVVAERAKVYRETTVTPAPADRIEAAVKKLVDRLIERHSFTPMWGLAGGDALVNVLELNLALDEAMAEFRVH